MLTMNKTRKINYFFDKKRENIDNSHLSKPTSMSNVKTVIEQPILLHLLQFAKNLH